MPMRLVQVERNARQNHHDPKRGSYRLRHPEIYREGASGGNEHERRPRIAPGAMGTRQRGLVKRRRMTVKAPSAMNPRATKT
jgi:hypothetical protein